MNLHQLIAMVLSHIRGMWRFRWYAVVLAWLIALAGWAFVATIPDTYQSRARIQIDTESMLEPLLQGLAIQTDMQTRVDMMTRALLTRPKLEKVARLTDLDLQADTPVQMNSLIGRLATNTSIQSNRQDRNLYTISHTGGDPATTKRVVQAFIDVFVEETLGENRVENNSAQQFLEEQIREYEQRLLEAEQKLVDFKKENVGRMPGEGGDFYVRLQTAMGQLSGMKTALRIADSRRDSLERQMLGEEPVFGMMPTAPQQQQALSNEVTDSIDVSLQENHSRLDELLLRFTDKHPEVQAIRETIDELERRRENEITKLQERLPSADVSATQELQQNPVYQSMKIAFNEAEIEVAGLRTQIATKQSEVSRLQAMVDIIPQVEANLGRLNRDYQVTKQQYDTLLQRLETARPSQQAEQSGENIEFQVIDPPSLPNYPVGPKRQLLNSALVVVALGAGLVLTFILHQLYPVYGDSRTLAESIDLPVLGVVSLKRDRAQKWRANFGRLAVVSAAALLLVVAGGVVLYGDTTRTIFQSIITLV